MGQQIRFGHEDAIRFAAWSGDRNPLHVDPDAARRSVFGQPVIHGVLTTIRALGSGLLQSSRPLRSLDVEFRSAVHPDTTCTIEPAPSQGGGSLSVRTGDASAVVLRVGDRGPETPADLSWLDRAVATRGSLPSLRQQPATPGVEDLQSGREIVATYTTGDVPSEYLDGGLLHPVQARVLALCSYVIGMEMPGLRSLFTRLRLELADDLEDSAELLYRARAVRFDPHFRLLDVRLEIATVSGRFVAAADLRSYVRFTPVETDAAAVASYLSPDAKFLADKIVFVTGGSRGLGAEITTAFAMAGCQVYASYHRDRTAAGDLRERLQSAGGRVEFLEGDAADRQWCEWAIRHIRTRHDRLDVLVLNACAPPAVLRLGPDSADAFNAYVADNLALAQVPLATCLPSLAASGATIVGISSSFVADPPPGFGHYVALKEAVESTIRTAVRESADTRAVLARPPRLQTAWNDTPTGVLGTIAARDAAVQIVNVVAEAARDEKPGVRILSEFPTLVPAATVSAPDEADASAPDFFLSLAASFTAEPLLDGLRFWFRELGVHAEIEVAPYGQILQTLLKPDGGLPGGPGVHVVLLRLRDWLRELRPEDAASPEFLSSYLEATARDLERAMRTHRSQASAETLLVICPSGGDHLDQAEALLGATEAELLARLAGLPGLTLVRASDFHAMYEVTADAIADHVREHLAHIPYQPGYLHTLSTIVIRHVHRKLAPARKLVAVDCDNTLWNGVVGEVGVEGVIFDESHAALHRMLMQLAESGVLIALCSKNEEADVWRVFDSRPDFALRRDAIVTAAVNWQPKSANLRAMAERLNLGLDSFVFIDDNPVECAEVRASCPQVLTLEWPQDAARAKRLLQHTWELDPRGATAEDRRRTELYKEEFKRQEFQAQTLTFRDFIASLELVVDIAPLAAEDVKRASQLTLRTNQFNFTTRRRDESELQALAAAGAHEIRTVRVRDRFGDYGLVGLLIAERSGDEVFADTFLLSCRVLGRGVEHQMVAELGRIAAASNAGAIRLRVDPTNRNTPARNFLQAIAPDNARPGQNGLLEVALPTAAAAAITFEPPSHAPAAVADENQVKGPSRQVDVSTIRSREDQIRRTAFELASPAELMAAIDGKPGPGAPRPASAAADAGFVFDAFAKALGTTAERVKEVDSLEGLGCDSFKIVEITVGLLEKYPSLPGTLLFEHRTVSDIARRIAALSAPPATTPAEAIRLASAQHGADRVSGDIAVVGMHLRCAGAQSPDELWELLSAARVSVTAVPEDRKYFLGRLQDTRPHFAGLLDDVDRFDAELFGITPREAELMDPQLRLFLEVAWSALEDAGCLGEGLDPDTGVFAGVMYGDYGYRANLVAKESENPFKCWEGFSLANRLSQVFGFRGPSLAIDTACSSSATAVHLACRALNAGDCSIAIAGGVNLILDPDRFVQLGRLGILSASGRCLAFGAEADGTVLGEGAGVVVLRPIADALRRGDRIYGVIKATGVSTGSGTVGFTAPNPVAQAEAIRRAVKASGVDPRTISYVETHGTGTALGDPIEVRGLELAYGEHDLWDPGIEGRQACSIGSIKPNIGHLEAGAGVMGLIKLLLQVQRGYLLPSITSADPNPQIPFANSPFSIQRTLTEWEPPVLRIGGALSPVPRRGSLNSFGVGGANAHIIVEEPPDVPATEATVHRPSHVLAVSARTAESLQRRLEDVERLLVTRPDVPLADACFSINTGQRHLKRRAAIVARTREEMIRSLTAMVSGEEPPGAVQGAGSRSEPEIAFLFTGQGSQYAGMGRDLYHTQPVFKGALDRCFELFGPLLTQGDLKASMFAVEGTTEAASLNQTGFTQPALFSLGYALAELWRSWGIRPRVVMGHSIGEITAMCVAGGLSLEDAVTMVAARGSLMQALPPGGAMTSVMASEARVAQAIAGMDGRVAIAAINAPEQIVISGEAAAVESVAAQLTAEGIKTKALVVSHAFHSPLMRPMLEAYASVLRRVHFMTPQMDFVSSVVGEAAAAELITTDYWLRNVTDPVRFTDGVRALDAIGVTAFLEIGPQPVLLGLGRQCLADADAPEHLWLASVRKDGAWTALLSSLGELYVAGQGVDWRGFDAPYSPHRVSLPPYPFAGKRHWIASVPAVTSVPLAEADKTDNLSQGAAAYEVVWRAQPRFSPLGSTSGRWVIFGEPDNATAALLRALEGAGATCTPAQPGSGPLEVENARGVVYLAGSGSNDSRSDPAATASVSVDEALSVMRAIAAQTGSDGPTLWIVTRDGVATGNDPDRLDVAHSALWGAGRTFSLEHPHLWGGLIDVSGRLDPDTAAREIAVEILSQQPEDQIAIRSEGRFVPRLTRRAAAPGGPPQVSATGTYLITGGLGALGLHTAKWLASRGARHLLLTSRRGIQTPGAVEAIRAIESLGASVSIVAADVARAEDVGALLDAVDATAPLAGIFHGAGVDDTTAILETEAGAAERVMRAKTAGAWLLHERTRHLPLHTFVCFSSIASVLGSAGRAAYAAANAFVDALAFERHRMHLPALSINWGPWAGGGMATDSALQQYSRVGNRGLVPAAALQMMEALMRDDAPQAVVADIDWDAFRTAYEARRPRPLIADLHETPVSSARPGAHPRAPWIERLAGTRADQRYDALMSLLQEEVAKTLGLDGPAEVAADQVFRDLGMDSLMSADFAQRLQKRLGIRSAAAVFEFPTARLLATHLLDRLELPNAEPPSELVAEAAVASVAAVTSASGGGFRQEPHDALTAYFTSESSEPPSHVATYGGKPSPGRTEGYRVEAEPEVFAFQRLAWPRRAPDLIAPRWRWMFVESARRLNIAPRVWLHRDAGRIVGHSGAIPVRLKIGDEEQLAAWLVETMVLPEYRSQAVGARLMVEAHEDLPFALSLGQTEQMRAIQLRLGWRQVAPLETAQLLIRPERVLRGKVPAPAAIAAGLAFRANAAFRDALKQRSNVAVRVIPRFDASHDRLWDSLSSEFTCAVRRDASYLNWKYVDQPGQGFLRLEVTGASGARGVVVLMFRDPDEVYKYRRAFIVDLVAPLSDTGFMADLLTVAIDVAGDRNADALLCLHVGAKLTNALQSAGFRMRKPSRYLLVRLAPDRAGGRDESLNERGWFVTHGDSDIDRPRDRGL